MAAVSYTHLDVYKRQTVTRLNREIVDELIYERTAVEARVLRDFSPRCTDVYKRQPQHS